MPSGIRGAAEYDSHMLEVIKSLRVFAEEYSHAVHLISERAQVVRQKGHWVEAPMLDRVVALMCTPENFDHNLELAGELLSWLPFWDELEGMSNEERKAWLTVLVLREGLEGHAKREFLRSINSVPGRPHSTRRFAVRAMEIHKKGESWAPVVKTLPCDWTMVNDPENSIRREVQLLARVLERCGVEPKPF